MQYFNKLQFIAIKFNKADVCLGPWESYDEWSRNPRAWHTKRFGSKTFEDIFQVIKPVPRDRWNTWNFQYGDVANIAEWRKWADQN